jgi:glycosyltransferase involved in cell wall biosynthesis
MVGRISPWKGQDVFLRAFGQAFSGDGARASIVGSPLFGEEDFDAEIQALAASLGLGGRVTFTGFRDDVAAELRTMDVLVHASVIPEPFGLVVVEGMAAGLAVIASDAGGPSEVVEHGVTGLLYPPGDVDALAAALRQAASDPDLRRRLGQAARRKAEEFRPAIVNPQVTEFYRQVLAAPHVTVGRRLRAALRRRRRRGWRPR